MIQRISPRFGAAAAVAGLALISAACGSSGSGTGGSGSASGTGHKATIAVVLSNLQDPFWQTVQCGMVKAAVDNKNAISVKFYDNPTYDTASIQAAYSSAELTNPDGMFLEVVQPTQLVSEVQGLMQKGVPVIGMSPQTPNQFLDIMNNQFNSTPLIDSFLKAIPKNGTVAVLGGLVTVEQVTERWQPLIAAVKKQRPDVTVLPVQYTNFDVPTATKDATAMLLAHPNITNFLGTSGPDAQGILAAMQQLKIAPGKIDFWAWDADPVQVQGVLDGYISHLYAQNALTKGEAAIVEIMKAIQADPSHKAIAPKAAADWYDAPLGDLTKANINDPSNAAYRPVTTATCPYKNP